MGRRQELRRQGRADCFGVTFDDQGRSIPPNLDCMFLSVIVGLCREPLESIAGPDLLRAVRIAIVWPLRTAVKDSEEP